MAVTASNAPVESGLDEALGGLGGIEPLGFGDVVTEGAVDAFEDVVDGDVAC